VRVSPEEIRTYGFFAFDNGLIWVTPSPPRSSTVCPPAPSGAAISHHEEREADEANRQP